MWVNYETLEKSNEEDIKVHEENKSLLSKYCLQKLLGWASCYRGINTFLKHQNTNFFLSDLLRKVFQSSITNWTDKTIWEECLGHQPPPPTSPWHTHTEDVCVESESRKWRKIMVSSLGVREWSCFYLSWLAQITASRCWVRLDAPNN